MKRSQISTLIALVALSALALGLAAGWLAAWLATYSGNPVLVWTGSVVILAVVALALRLMHRFTRAFLRDVRRLSEAGQLVLSANPTYRIPLQGHPDIQALTQVFNQFSDRFAELQQTRADAIQQARADLEEERTLLATLMAELTEGVIVCNLDGQILLYNRSAHRLLDASTQAEQGVFVGLGRSIFGMLDRNTIAYAVEQVQNRHLHRSNNEAAIITNFMTTAANGRLLRARLAAFSTPEGELRGYILTVQDVSEGIERSQRRDALLQTLTEKLRAAVGAIRAAIETVESFPDMPTAQRQRFQQVIHDEATSLSAQIDDTLRRYASDLRAQWQLEEIAAADLILAVQHYLHQRCAVALTGQASDDALWLKIDSYTLMQGVSHLVDSLHTEFGVAEVRLELSMVERYAALDIIWPAHMVAPTVWRQWSERAFVTDDSDGVITLREVAERHGGEVWFQMDATGARAYFRLLLPRAASKAATGGSSDRRPAIPSRPEYYDFDLFHQPGQSAELDDRPLHTLVYTVFDTETTGLTPGLDEIISIGALRIVNGRLLRQEVFEQLIDPQRPIPAAATAIHGITDAMVRQQPSIESVLPRFRTFVEDTVLVGHNLAFDMRMLREKEQSTGVCFVNPILDTLLLSVVLHPEESQHSLEAIAQRLGVQALGRHTALGDAIVTGEIFLRMIPLLQARGIHTLRQAREAAQQTYFARLEY
ncbi:MAG TPA: DNA polymerase III subunit epsilon [Chloroflexi bacterium]|nr:DNA polymerase III subunit epsilon [Chloroflexota bacterium]